jgi:hypothetical protein
MTAVEPTSKEVKIKEERHISLSLRSREAGNSSTDTKWIDKKYRIEKCCPRENHQPKFKSFEVDFAVVA